MTETIQSILKGSKALADRYKNDKTFRANVNKGGVKFLQNLKGKNKSKGKTDQAKAMPTETMPTETKTPQSTNKMLIYGGIGLLVLLFIAKR